MNALLDTHVFLWWINDNPRLPVYIRSIIADSKNELFFSAACCWEIAIKYRLGRIKLPQKPDIFIIDQLAKNAVRSLPIHASHALYECNLPNLHRDPFDRIIVSQSKIEKMPVITGDPLIKQYKVSVIWSKE
jgi:PIN domain nuclease of toxin-antitoxin system